MRHPITTTGIETTESLPQEIKSTLFIGFTLALFQAIDGVLTSLGISRFGIEFEGNPFLRNLMANFGHIQILAIVKILAIFLVVFITNRAINQPWVRSAMGAVSFVYFFCAILPWTYILFVQPYVGN